MKINFTLMASIAGGILSIGALWYFTKDAITGDVIEQHTRDIAEIRLGRACEANARLENPEKQLSTYIYCVDGSVSKKQVAK